MIKKNNENPNKKLKLQNKLILLTLVSSIGMIVLLSLFYLSLDSSLMKEKRARSQTLSEVGINIITYIHSLALSGVLEESEAKELANNTIQSAIYGTDGYFWINDSHGVLQMQPYTPDLVGKNMTETSDIEVNSYFKDFISTAMSGGGWVEYYWPKTNNLGHYRKISYVAYFEPWDYILGTGVYLDDMQQEINKHTLRSLIVFIIFTIMLTVLSSFLTRKFMRQLNVMAIHDPLTNLYSRRFLNETIKDIELKHNREKNTLSVLFLDIDFFKKINDTYGHSTGDEILSAVGEIIRKTSRPGDLCVRYGGEEFVLVILSENVEAVITLAERIRKNIQEKVFINKGVQFFVTISGGIAIREIEESIETTFSRADANLYKAKESGRNRVISPLSKSE
jgi:diguanylate cyclase (GGDEF)-like protein